MTEIIIQKCPKCFGRSVVDNTQCSYCHGNRIVTDQPLQLPESIAGLENVHEMDIKNESGFYLSNIKITTNRKDCEIQHPSILELNEVKKGAIIFACPPDIEEPRVEILLSITATGRKVRRV